MSDITLSCGFGCSSIDGCQGHCDKPAQADTYRGWTIHQGRWPEPAWMATGPNYDASYEGEEDGFVDNGEKADAKTRDLLIAEIDNWLEENASLAITVAAFGWAAWIDRDNRPSGDYGFAGIASAFVYGGALIVSLFAWLIWALAA